MGRFLAKRVYRYNRTTDRFDRMPRLGLYDNPFRMLQDRQGRYWLSTWGEGLFRMEVDDKNAIHYVSESLSGENEDEVQNLKYAFCLFEDSHWGYLWMLGYYGLTIARIEDEHLVAIPSDKLATQTNNLFNRICADREGNIWISAAGDGAYQLIVNDSQISNYSLPVWQDKREGLVLSSGGYQE